MSGMTATRRHTGTGRQVNRITTPCASVTQRMDSTTRSARESSATHARNPLVTYFSVVVYVCLRRLAKSKD